MIPLKFRAWDGLHQKMLFWTMNDLCTWDKKDEKPSALDDWMQFTGRLDKNGKEIYDGDILKHDLWGVSEVYWDKEGACFRGKNDEHDITLADHQLKRSKVIGNIYENSNLLK